MAPKMNKKVVIGLISLGLVGSIGTGFYFALADSTKNDIGHKAEEKVKEAKAKKTTTKWDHLLDEEGKDKKPDTRKDVLGKILNDEGDKEAKLASILSPEETNKKLPSASDVALKAIDALPTDKPKVITASNPVAVPGETPVIHLPNQPNPKIPIVPPTKDLEETEKVDPVIPIPVVPPESGGGGDKEPEIDKPVIPDPINEAPQLYAENQTIHVGTGFNAFRNVGAMDAEDGDLSHAIQVIANNVNWDKEGQYFVTYKVTDSKGASTTLTIIVTVINDAPEIQAENVTLSAGDEFQPLKDVRASDTEDGDVTERIRVVANDVDMSSPGTYHVTYEVSDKHGKTTSKTIEVLVVNDVPVIVAADKTVTIGTMFDPFEGVTASDKQDGDITSLLQVTNNAVDTAVAGVYSVTYQVTDSHGAKVEKTIQITVLDPNQAPEIEVTNDTLSFYVGDDVDWLAGVTAFDAEDGDITANIEVDTTTVDLQTPGEYQITYHVTDSHGVRTDKTVNVQILPVEDKE
ncbi:immunoglobulin-like domain-containing protein [Listeria booriae]|uniref:immunoglobulin-like domain-containing protein n=1 Tax=Listeria booriae TaxID=1552123 RepID=UPI001E620459|nr:immunoglobulin-like domain-containing protein [Listeria booriae]MCD2208594.1 DUF5011 domain-containing protein [Listeria booriae]